MKYFINSFYSYYILDTDNFMYTSSRLGYSDHDVARQKQGLSKVVSKHRKNKNNPTH